MTEAFIEEDGYAVYCCAIVHEAARGKGYLGPKLAGRIPCIHTAKTAKMSSSGYIVDEIYRNVLLLRSIFFRLILSSKSNS